MRLTDKGAERKIDQALQAKVDKKGDRENNNWRKGTFDKGKKWFINKDKAKVDKGKERLIRERNVWWRIYQ